MDRLPDLAIREIAIWIARSGQRYDTARTAARLAIAGVPRLARELWRLVDAGCEATGPAKRPKCWVRPRVRRALCRQGARVVGPRELVYVYRLSARDVTPCLRAGHGGVLYKDLERILAEGSRIDPAPDDIRAIRAAIFAVSVPNEVRNGPKWVRHLQAKFVRENSRVAFAIVLDLVDRFLSCK